MVRNPRQAWCGCPAENPGTILDTPAVGRCPDGCAGKDQPGSEGHANSSRRGHRDRWRPARAAPAPGPAAPDRRPTAGSGSRHHHLNRMVAGMARTLHRPPCMAGPTAAGLVAIAVGLELPARTPGSLASTGGHAMRWPRRHGPAWPCVGRHRHRRPHARGHMASPAGSRRTAAGVRAGALFRSGCPAAQGALPRASKGPGAPHVPRWHPHLPTP